MKVVYPALRLRENQVNCPTNKAKLKSVHPFGSYGAAADTQIHMINLYPPLFETRVYKISILINWLTVVFPHPRGPIIKAE